MIISVIIPVYNASLLLKRCLDSVFEQKGNYILDVICIDDGSTDDSAEIIMNYQKKIILLKQTNRGPASARNRGTKAASGKYLAFLDADDYWEPDFLLETVSFLESNPEAVAVSVGQKHISIKNESAIVPDFLQTQPDKINNACLLINFYSFWAKHFHICTGSILMRTEIVKQTGGQRTELRITEDLEFWAFLATFGEIGFVPKVLFTSDGIKVTKQTGWIKKNRKRWASAPTVEDWEKRIVKVIPQKDLKYFHIARGRIAQNLCYFMIMSGRSQMARKTCLKYGKSFPKNRVSWLLLTGAKNSLLWIAVANIIKIKEYTRIIK